MTIALKGGKELSAFLQAFPKRLQSGAVRSGVIASSKVFREKARANVATKSGQLAKAIRSRSTRVSKDGTVTGGVYVDPKKPHGFLGNWIEYGTSPHFITPGDSGLSSRQLTRRANVSGQSENDDGSMIIGNKHVRGAVWHPGIAPMPFMRPAFDTEQQEAIKAFGEQIRTYMAKRTGFTTPLLELDDAA